MLAFSVVLVTLVQTPVMKAQALTEQRELSLSFRNPISSQWDFSLPRLKITVFFLFYTFLAWETERWSSCWQLEHGEPFLSSLGHLFR